MAVLLAGILTAIFSLSKVLSWLMLYHPVLVQAFFFGLILATIPIIARNIKQWTISIIITGIIASIGMYFLVGLVPIQTPNAGWFLFLCGAIAICAMILPGISGSFILLLLGKYQYIVEAVSHREFPILILVALGCLIGILTFVRFLNWLLDQYHDFTIITLTGLVIGSLRKIWPWKANLQVLITHKGKVVPIEQVNIFPTQWSLEILWALLLFLAGLGIACALGKTSLKKII